MRIRRVQADLDRHHPFGGAVTSAKASLNRVVPWGRSFDEYVRMFDLSEADLDKPILGCADGPANFNAIHTEGGGNVLSLDPIYTFSGGEIRGRIEEAVGPIVEGTLAHYDTYIWKEYPSLDALVELRLKSMERFLEDYDAGLEEGRYRPHALPELPLEDGQFGLALCSHFLFTYSAHFTTAFHIDAVVEMRRAAREVRIFPILDMDGGPSPHIEAVTDALRGRGYEVTLQEVPYEFQKGGNRMLRVR